MQDIIVDSKRFAGERYRITDWITPDALEVKDLFDELELSSPYDTLIACWQWINDNVSYPTDRLGRMVDRQELTSFGSLRYVNYEDFWFFPSELIARARLSGRNGRKTLGDCDDVALCLVSLMRNKLSAVDIYCAMGDYFNGQAAGHAWVKCRLNGVWHIVDPTSEVGTPFNWDQYDEFVLFNDREVNELKPVEGILGNIARST